MRYCAVNFLEFGEWNLKQNENNIMTENMLDTSSDQDLEEYKKNTCKILRENTQYATARVVENLFDKELEMRKLIRVLNTISNS